MDDENKKYGFRTLNKFFDNVNDFHTATIAHHDLSNIEHREHFLRGLDRLNYIRNNNIPILSVNIATNDKTTGYHMEFNNTEYDSCLVDSIIKSGFNNMKILSIYKTIDVSELELTHISEHMIIYKIPTYGYEDIRDDTIIEHIIKKHFNCDNLLEIDSI
jgi:hypothetical protein